MTRPKSTIQPVPRVALTPEEAAESLGMSLSYLNQIRDKEGIPYVQFGQKCCRYPVDALNQWICDKATNKK